MPKIAQDTGVLGESFVIKVREDSKGRVTLTNALNKASLKATRGPHTAKGSGESSELELS